MAGEPPIWLIGCGAMTGAMLRGWLDAGRPASRFTVIDPNVIELPDGVARADAPPAAGFGHAIVQLGVKPQMLDEVAPGLAPLTGDETVIVSIMAGVEIASLRRRFPDAAAIVRVMPNLAAALRTAAIGLVSDRPGSAETRAVCALAAELGAVESIDERHFDLVTALAGSTPAFVYRFIDALAEAGAALGLDREQALRLAVATVDGAASLAAASAESPGALADRVASPGGTTRAGLDVLDRDDALNRLVHETIEAAMRRGGEMAAASRR